MSQQIIITTPENSGQGTPIATAFDYCNSNFTQLFSRAQSSPPLTFVGSLGDQAGMYAYDSSYFYYCFADYDGSSVIWAAVSQAGNISATQLLYGNTTVDIPTPGANVLISVNGYPNVATIAPRQFDVAGNIGAGGNIYAVGTITNGANITANGYIRAIGNVRGGNIRSDGYVSAVGNITGAYIIGDGSLITGIDIIANGTSEVTIPTSDSNVLINVNGTTIGTFTSTGLEISADISAVGNITGTYILGNGSLLTGISGTGNYSNANVADYLPTYSGNITANVISATGNIEATYFIGNGSQLTGISGTGNYGNSNVAAYLPTYTGNLQAGNLDVTNDFYIGGTAFTRTLTVGTRTTPVTVPLASNNSFNVLARTGNVVVYTT